MIRDKAAHLAGATLLVLALLAIAWKANERGQQVDGKRSLWLAPSH